jgi:N4-gp56 family major capsid protein
MAVNLASKYSDKVDERFKLKSLTDAATNQDYDWQGVNAVTIYGVSTSAMNDYSMTGTSRYGTAAELGNTTQTLTLSRDRSFTFTIDRKNYQDTQMVMESGKALARQIDEVITPEIDTYRLAAMSAAGIAAGNTATAAVTASNAYSVLLNGGVALDEDKVPQGGRVAFVTPTYYSFLKQDPGFIKATEIAQNMLINGQVGEVDGVKIVKVPSIYLPANTAFVITNSIACVAPKKLEDYKIHDNPPGINGWLVEGRLRYDAFVPNNKANAIYVHKTA